MYYFLVFKIHMCIYHNSLGLFIEKHLGVRVRGFPVQTPLGNRLGLGTQPCYEAPADFRVKILEKQWSTSGEWRYPFHNDPQLDVGQPNSS